MPARAGTGLYLRFAPTKPPAGSCPLRGNDPFRKQASRCRISQASRIGQRCCGPRRGASVRNHRRARSFIASYTALAVSRRAAGGPGIQGLPPVKKF